MAVYDGIGDNNDDIIDIDDIPTDASEEVRQKTHHKAAMALLRSYPHAGLWAQRCSIRPQQSMQKQLVKDSGLAWERGQLEKLEAEGQREFRLLEMHRGIYTNGGCIGLAESRALRPHFVNDIYSKSIANPSNRVNAQSASSWFHVCSLGSQARTTRR